jgi:4-amino-4-deoxy-L-arabinose transferase-like glycosyltransferase
VLVGLWLRLRGLSAEGFADDEVHKWLAANRYLAGDFGGDDVEHPMLMKWLVAGALALFRGVLPPESITRLPNACAGALTVWATALLGRRLFGRAAALIGAGLVALSSTAIGYHRIAKEDVLLGLFVVLSLWCFAEAKAAAEDGLAGRQSRWEAWSAAALGAAFASKYFFFYILVPVVAYLWLRPVSAWRVPLRRWLSLVGIALAVFLAINWSFLLPSTHEYLLRHVGGDVIDDRGVSESLLFMGRLHGNLGFRGDATPAWFFGAFAAFKFATPTALLGAIGIAIALWRRAPAHRILLAWGLVFSLFFVVAGSKYGRFFISVTPPFLLLAGHAAVALAGVAGRTLAGAAAAARGAPAGRIRAVVVAALALVALGAEARAAAAHAPHYRLYLNALAGGDRQVGWFLPHCDYFDAGMREAVRWVTARAEPGAEICSEVDWTIRLYASEAGRSDLVSRPLLAGRCCVGPAPCYVVVHAGRLYRHNLAAVERLASRVPEHAESIRGLEAARVYRLDAGTSPFPAPAPDPGSVSAR